MGKRQWHRAETVVLIDVLHHIKLACDRRGREKDAKNQSRGAQRLSLPIALLKATVTLRSGWEEDCRLRWLCSALRKRDAPADCSRTAGTLCVATNLDVRTPAACTVHV